MKTKFKWRFAWWLGILASAFIANQSFGTGSTILSMLCGGIGAAAFLFIRPNVSIKDRMKKVSLFELMLPCFLVVFAAVQDFEHMNRYLALFPYLVIFLAGGAAGGRIFLERE